MVKVLVPRNREKMNSIAIRRFGTMLAGVLMVCSAAGFAQSKKKVTEPSKMAAPVQGTAAQGTVSQEASAPAAMVPGQTTVPGETTVTGQTAAPAGVPAASTPPAPVPTNVPPPVATAEQGTVVATPAMDASRYTIGPDDALQVTVWKEPTLSGTFPVRPDGMISLVLVGDMPAAGLTPMQLGVNITERLKKYIQEPSVSVVVTAVNSQRIFVIGEVGHVGPIMMTPGMSPLQAIAAAGGPTAFAHSKNIYILRNTQGKQKKIPFNYKLALRGDDKQLIALQPGDTIVVP